jgi:transcriptional regulator with XRE-family HTH domain
MSPPSPHLALLQQVLQVAEANGLDQARLAERAGLSPETISRAKKRSDMDIGTLEALATVVGLELVLQPRPAAVSPLAQPRFALAWSNPEADEGVLVRKALLEARFEALADAALTLGLPRLHAELTALQQRGAIDETRHAGLLRLLANIRKGLDGADAAAA